MFSPIRARLIRAALAAAGLAAAVAAPMRNAVGDDCYTSSYCQGNSCFMELQCVQTFCYSDASCNNGYQGDQITNIYDEGYCGDGPCPGCECLFFPPLYSTRTNCTCN